MLLVNERPDSSATLVDSIAVCENTFPKIRKTYALFAPPHRVLSVGFTYFFLVWRTSSFATIFALIGYSIRGINSGLFTILWSSKIHNRGMVLIRLFSSVSVFSGQCNCRPVWCIFKRSERWVPRPLLRNSRVSIVALRLRDIPNAWNSSTRPIGYSVVQRSIIGLKMGATSIKLT